MAGKKPWLWWYVIRGVTTSGRYLLSTADGIILKSPNNLYFGFLGMQVRVGLNLLAGKLAFLGDSAGGPLFRRTCIPFTPVLNILTPYA